MDECLRAAIEATQAQAKIRVMMADEIAEFTAKLARVFRAMSVDEGADPEAQAAAGTASLIAAGLGLGRPAEQAARQVPAIAAAPAAQEPKCNPKTSIRKDRVICIECGQSFSMLSKSHLAKHGLTGEEYKAKWGISPKAHLMSHEMLKKHRDSVANLTKKAKAKRAGGH